MLLFQYISPSPCISNFLEEISSLSHSIIILYFFRCIPFLSFSVHLCMKCSPGISNFLEEISSLFHSIAFLYFLACSLRKAFLSFLAILWNSAFNWVYISFCPLPLASLLFSAACKASSRDHFAF